MDPDIVVDHIAPCCPHNLFYSLTLFCPALFNINSQSPTLNIWVGARATERYQPIPDGFHNVGLRGWALKRRLIFLCEVWQAMHWSTALQTQKKHKKTHFQICFIYFLLFISGSFAVELRARTFRWVFSVSPKEHVSLSLCLFVHELLVILFFSLLLLHVLHQSLSIKVFVQSVCPLNCL